MYYGKGNRKFAMDFIKTCQKHGISFLDGGNFQQRYKNIQMISEQVPEGLDMGFCKDLEFTSPQDFKSGQTFPPGNVCSRWDYCTDSGKELKIEDCRVLKKTQNDVQKLGYFSEG